LGSGALVILAAVEGGEETETPDVSDGIGLAEALLGLGGFRVLGVVEDRDELVITIETTAAVTGCAICGMCAEAHDRLEVAIRDLGDVDGTFRACRRTSGDHLTGRDGGVPSGR
jgi:hypothetical protein